jgi:hypothetical protein
VADVRSVSAMEPPAWTGWLARWLRRPGARNGAATPVREAPLPPPVPASAMRAVEESVAQEALGVSESAWARMMTKVRDATKADCVFAVEAAGLVVARTGTYGRAEVDRVAAHLSRSFDFLDPLTEIGSAVESVCVMFTEGRWLTAMRIVPAENIVVTIGVIGPYTIVREDRERIRSVFTTVFLREWARQGAPVPHV